LSLFTQNITRTNTDSLVSTSPLLITNSVNLRKTVFAKPVTERLVFSYGTTFFPQNPFEPHADNQGSPPAENANTSSHQRVSLEESRDIILYSPHPLFTSSTRRKSITFEYQLLYYIFLYRQTKLDCCCCRRFFIFLLNNCWSRWFVQRFY
jgi:hypothetical protein